MFFSLKNESIKKIKKKFFKDKKNCGEDFLLFFLFRGNQKELKTQSNYEWRNLHENLYFKKNDFFSLLLD